MDCIVGSVARPQRVLILRFGMLVHSLPLAIYAVLLLFTNPHAEIIPYSHRIVSQLNTHPRNHEWTDPRTRLEVALHCAILTTVRPTTSPAM